MSELKLARIFYLTLGWVFFGLGFVGVFLPVLPTTPFMLLALWAFARSSERLRDWLYHHPRYGAALQQWQQHRVIPLRAKLLALCCMSISLVYLIVFSSAPEFAVWSAAGLMGIGAAYILTKPSQPASPLSVERVETGEG